MMQEEKIKERKSLKKWLQGLGLGAIVFFTLKGFVWLAIFLGLGSLIGC